MADGNITSPAISGAWKAEQARQLEAIRKTKETPNGATSGTAA